MHIGYLCITVYIEALFVLLYLSFKSFRCRFVSLLAPNPGDATANPENSVKIGPENVEIVGLAETTNKNINKSKKTSAKHKSSSPALRAERVD